MDLSCLAADHPEMKMMSIDAHTWMVRLALRKAVAAAEGIDEHRAQPDHAAVHRGHDLEGSEARGEVRQVDADGFDSVLDADQGATDQGAGRQVG